MIFGAGSVGPGEIRVDAQLVERLDQYVDIVAQNLGQDLVHLSLLTLGLHAGPELGLDHGHRRLYVAPLMVVGVELDRLAFMPNGTRLVNGLAALVVAVVVSCGGREAPDANADAHWPAPSLR